jgi:hypothetical protein
MVGPFKKAKGGFTHIFHSGGQIHQMDRSKAAASITATKVMEFIREMMYKIGEPNNIITNNRTQFTMREFIDFCADARIKVNISLTPAGQWTSRMILRYDPTWS